MATAQKELTNQQLQREYIGARSLGFQRGARRLPQVSDDVATHVQCNTYDLMACDSEVAAALFLIVTFVFADGLQSAPAVSEKDPRYALAVDIRDHLERTTCGLQRPLKDTLEMIVKEALIQGNKIAEKVYDIPTVGPDAYKLVLKQLKVKPKGATAFVVDEFYNLIGLAPTNRGISLDIKENSTVIRPEKFVIATYRMKDEDPRGTSILRAAVKPWNVKHLVWPEFITYLMRCAVPGLVGKLSENAKDKIERDSQGNETRVSAIDELLSQLVNFKNSTAIALDSGYELEALEIVGKGEIWDFAFNSIINKEIRKAILLQDLATADSTHQTKGSTDSQMGIVEMLVWSIKTWAAEIVYSQIYKPQVAYNWGDEIAAELTPKPALGDYERREWFQDADAVTTLCTATVTDENGNSRPLLTYSQIQSLLTQIGLPAPSEEEVAAMRAKATQPQQQNNQNKNQQQQEAAN
jgi:hypothetical protein